jgi:hypothetical protein
LFVVEFGLLDDRTVGVVFEGTTMVMRSLCGPTVVSAPIFRFNKGRIFSNLTISNKNVMVFDYCY